MAQGINVRAMREADIEPARQLWRLVPEMGLSPDSDSAPSLAAFLLRNPGTSLVAYDGDQLVGTVLGGYDGRRGYIYHLAVHDDYRGIGLGRDLLQRVVKLLVKVGADKIHLMVFGDNEQAISFYRHLGWMERTDITLFSMFARGASAR